jgi:hypothetical protein
MILGGVTRGQELVMVIYEVNLTVEAAHSAAFQAWLPKHAQEVVATGCFERATIYARDRADEPPDAALWTVHYLAPSREALATYLRDHAPRLRQDGLSRFGAAFSASRRLLEALG